MNDRPIKNVETLAILMIFACGPLSLIVHALYYYFTRPENIFASDLLLYYTIAQSLINSFVFDVVVYVLYRRFQTINELIDQLDQLFGALWIALKIRRIRELHTGESFQILSFVNESKELMSFNRFFMNSISIL